MNRLILGTLAGLLLPLVASGAGRTAISLNGTWHLGDSVGAEDMPTVYRHTVPVPGLAYLAQPRFENVGQFESREYLWILIYKKMRPPMEIPPVGVSLQKRNYFWYERTFRVPQRRQVAILKINKAQFGTAVWLNGKKIGEHYGCFTAGYFDLTPAIRWNGENRLVVRVGAHPGVLPLFVPAGTDQEKKFWIPGIYDDVSLLLSDNPVIEWVQVAPRIASSEIVVETALKNYGTRPVSFTVTQRVRTWKGGDEAGAAPSERGRLGPGEEKKIRQSLHIRGAVLWTPEHPFLYVLDTGTGGDSSTTRFGMREFRFDTATRRAYLNGKVYFLRGSNITLHRFFEDPKAGALPWNEQWVRKLLGDIPKRMHWNSFRFCIGPVPDKWLDIADETGLLIQNEFFIWTGRQNWHKQWSTQELIKEYSEWMRDNWNHPSVAIWDASNETVTDVLGNQVIPAVRSLDLSNRPWENSYNLPTGPDDPVEDHPYLFNKMRDTGPVPDLGMLELEHTNVPPLGSAYYTGHALILNEYGWLWLNRDGSPTLLTKDVYKNLIGPNSTADQRRSLDAYLLAGLTEYWRAHRKYAGVLHFVYLTASYPDDWTSDHFRDIEHLKLDPEFEKEVGEAFQPLGVYIDFWHTKLTGGSKHRFLVMMVNDKYKTAKGKVVCSLERAGGGAVAQKEVNFEIPGLGQQTYACDLDIPAVPGKFLLKATAYPQGDWPEGPTVSLRRVTVEKQ